MTDWSILGGNPAPGTPETFDAVAGVLGPIVEASEGSSTTIHSIAQQAGSLVWSGVAADAFAESVRAIPIDLAELATAHQTAVRALSEYSATLQNLQGQAAQILSRATSAQAQADSASSRLSSAQGSYTQAEERYVLYTAEADSLEFAKHAADLAGNVAASSRLAQEVTAAIRLRNAAWSDRSAAQEQIDSAQSALNGFRQDVADEQAAARSVAAQRVMAAQNLCMLLGTASEFVVGKRSWLDRVRNDFDPMAAFSWKRVEGDLVATDHILLRGASDIDAFARAHAETIRNAADIVNRYASDVSNLANAVAPAFTVVALAIDDVSLVLPPPADAAGLALAKEVAAVPSEVSTVADVVGAGSAGVALGADELAEVPAAEKTAQFESDKKALESSSVAVLFDGVGIATSGLPGIDEVPSTLAEGGVKNTVRAVAGPVVQDYVTPHLETAALSKVNEQ